jgi:hypothetical protein
VHIAIGESLQRPVIAANRIVEIAFPDEAGQFHAARQLHGGLERMTHRLNLIQIPAQLAALAGLVLLAIRRARAGQRRRAGFCALVLAALLINAFVCGVFSGATERYQSRVAWLAVVAVLAAGPMAWRRRTPDGTSVPPPQRCSPRRDDGIVRHSGSSIPSGAS